MCIKSYKEGKEDGKKEIEIQVYAKLYEYEYLFKCNSYTKMIKEIGEIISNK